jgi:hypothetical protein
MRAAARSDASAALKRDFSFRRLAAGRRFSRDLIPVARICETAVKPVAELVWVEFPVSAALAGNHHARSGHPRQPRDTDEFPGHPHRRVAYDS